MRVVRIAAANLAAAGVPPFAGVGRLQRQVEDGDLLGSQTSATLGEQQFQQPLKTDDVVAQRIAQIVVGRIERRQIEGIDADRATWTETDVLTADVLAQRSVLLFRFGVDDDAAAAAAAFAGCRHHAWPGTAGD